MKRPSWLRGEPDEPKAEDAKAPKASPSEEAEKVSVPFGKTPKAKASPPPKSKSKAKKPKPEPKKAKVVAKKAQAEKPTASERAEQRKRAKASKPKPKPTAAKSIAKKVVEAEKVAKPEKGKAKASKPKPAKRRRGRDEPKSATEPGRKRRAPVVRAKAAKAGSAVGSQLKEGTDETRKRTRSVAPQIGKALLKAAGAIFAIFFNVLGFVLGVLLAVGAFVAGPGRAVLARVRKIVDALSRQLTPARALAIVVAGTAVLLALSQFADYRSVSIGTDAYSGVETVAPAPEIERVATGEAHSYVFVPVAALALLLLPFALRGRWRICRLIALGGAAAVVVALLVDRPAGLDPGEAARAFDGVKGTLLGGFYAELFAGALLAASALLLARELRAGVAVKPVPAARTPRKKQRLRLPRPRPGDEGEEAPA